MGISPDVCQQGGIGQAVVQPHARNPRSTEVRQLGRKPPDKSEVRRTLPLTARKPAIRTVMTFLESVRELRLQGSN